MSDFDPRAFGGPPDTQIEPEPVTPPPPVPEPEPEEDTTEADVEALLASQFGGFSFFLQKNREDLKIGITEDGIVVSPDDVNATETVNVLDYIVREGIVAPTRIKGLLENTVWWQSTDKAMRDFDTAWAEMSEPERDEFLEPVTELLEKEAQFLGATLTPGQMFRLAKDILRLGEADDQEYIRGALTAELKFDPTAAPAASAFGASVDDMQILASKYFVPIDDETAQKFANQVYTGEKTAVEMEQYFRLMAKETFPALSEAIDLGISPTDYFAPYKYEIERMLDRPNINLYEEFGDVIQHIPDGGGQARPMTLGEVRKYVRGLPEWQQSTQGKDSARALAFAIGRTFGEVA